jgi:hypothetical protein
MNYELICAWLNLSPADWPPDHYTLLGLPRGEPDPLRIEQHVHERLARLRCYQLSQPEQASAAMNLLAQAFSCLTNPVAKQTYDAQLLGRQADTQVLTTPPTLTRLHEGDVPTERMEPVTLINGAAVADTSVVETLPAQAVADTQAEWRNLAPPVRLAVAVSPSEAPAAPPAAVPARVVDPLAQEVEAALASRAANRGLATRRQLFERVWLTRQLLREWQLIGKTLVRLRTQSRKPADDAELGVRLNATAEYLREFPRLLGRPGMPGYRVLVLRKLGSPLKAIQEIDAEQRKALTKDWLAGHTLLLGYRRCLLRRLRLRRKSSGWARCIGTVRAYVADNAEVILTVLGVLLLIVALCYFA